MRDLRFKLHYGNTTYKLLLFPPSQTKFNKSIETYIWILKSGHSCIYSLTQTLARVHARFQAQNQTWQASLINRCCRVPKWWVKVSYGHRESGLGVGSAILSSQISVPPHLTGPCVEWGYIQKLKLLFTEGTGHKQCYFGTQVSKCVRAEKERAHSAFLH